VRMFESGESMVNKTENDMVRVVFRLTPEYVARLGTAGRRCLRRMWLLSSMLSGGMFCENDERFALRSKVLHLGGQN